MRFSKPMRFLAVIMAALMVFHCIAPSSAYAVGYGQFVSGDAGTDTIQSWSVKSEQTLYQNGRILIYSYDQLQMIGSEGSIGYCRSNGVVTGSDLKASLQQEGLIPNRITEETLLHCVRELFTSLGMIGIDTDEEPFMASIDHFGENNLTIYNWEENQYASRGRYGLLSLMILALLDLGLITITYDE